jgi:carbonic anhydrase/acetyltransferase-like protein (isoleucine patch superfamily)
MAIYQFETLVPTIDDDTFIFDSADIIGDVTIQAQASIWAHVSIRGDNAAIKIGRGSNVQEGSVLHVDRDCPLTVHDNVTVGHQAMLHGCTIGEGSLIGMQAIVLNNANVGRNCLIGAGALIPEGRRIPDNSLVVGVGKIVRELSSEEIRAMHEDTQHYVNRARLYRKSLKKLR